MRLLIFLSEGIKFAVFQIESRTIEIVSESAVRPACPVVLGRLLGASFYTLHEQLEGCLRILA